jgi:starvation-inducible DNA-binding protein
MLTPFDQIEGEMRNGRERSEGVRQSHARDPTNLTAKATTNISGALNALLADTFALYLKTKNFH